MPVLKAAFAAGTYYVFFVRAKENVSAKSLRVNSIFLVQLRKNSGESSCRFLLVKKNLRYQLAMRVIVRVCELALDLGVNLVGWAAGLSTGLAQEMQKQFLVEGNNAKGCFRILDHDASRFGTDYPSRNSCVALWKPV
jgi:hypothetical protein